jgi:hypothetical protein
MQRAKQPGRYASPGCSPQVSISIARAIVRTVKKSRRNLMLVCVVLGAFVNIAVAWSCAIWSRPNPAAATELPSSVSAGLWQQIAPDAWKREVDEVHQLSTFSTGGGRQESLGVEIDTVSHAAQDSADIGINQYRLQTWTVFEFRTGWPLRTVCSTGAESSSDGKLVTALAWVSSADFDWISLNRGQLLPYGPIWTGLIANTVFYAAIIWLLIRGPIELRRRMRQLRGQCQACGYPIRTSSVCAECGIAVPRQALSPVESTAHLQRRIPRSPVAPSQTKDHLRG